MTTVHPTPIPFAPTPRRRAAGRATGLAVALSSLLLAGCFGGGGGDVVAVPDTPNTVPSSATASPEAYSRYVGSLVADDRGDPLDLSGVVPPTSDTALPIVVS